MPVAVLITTGKIANRNTTAILDGASMPNMKMNSGASATVGVAYTADTQGSIKSLAVSLLAMTMPSKMPSTAATAKPTKIGKPTEVGKAAGTGKAATAGKPVKPQHFDLPKQPNTAKAPAVKFQQGRHIEGSEHWQGQQYAAFRNYHSEWHDQGWWHNHYHNNIRFVFGAPYYFNAGYWFPAWGYYPNVYYAWDGPIYAYHHLPPDQVIANVQATLQQQGYYHGDVDGLAGPLTRAALADYQRDHGLYETAAIDRPTLESLGMT